MEASSLAPGRNRRVVAIVAAAAVAAAVAVVGATLLQTRGERTTVPGAVTKPLPGLPTLQLEFGLRTDAEARALARAQALLDKDGKVAQAAAIFRRYPSFEAQLGLAFTRWRGPQSLAAVRKLVGAHPNNPAGLLNLGWADYQAGHNADAVAAWEKTATEYRNSPYGVDAEDPLHYPQDPIPGLPVVVTGLSLPRSIASLPPARQLVALGRAAAKPDVRAKLLYGATLWGLRRPVSAERQFMAAAKLAPHDPLARTLAAVGLFSKANPTPAFGHLGPLTAVFPKAAVVQFHLGVLLLYIGERKKAAEHLQTTVADAPQSPYAKPAKTLIASLANTRPK
jgi:tetratricopeptide (TPR) repeat protein